MKRIFAANIRGTVDSDPNVAQCDFVS